MLELLGTVFSAIVGGGATGLLGVMLQRWFDYKNKAQDIEVLKLKHAQEKEVRQIDIQQTKAEWDGRNMVAISEGEAAQGVEDSKTLAASFASDRGTYLPGDAVKSSKFATWTMAAVDMVRGLIRPCLTAYLVWVTHSMYRDVQSILAAHGEAISAVQAADLSKHIVGTILYLTVTCVTWWFGTRNKGQAPTMK